MGAPGQAFFCKKGHLYHWIDDDLDWDEQLDHEAAAELVLGCPCGEEAVKSVCHYGEPNDCFILPGPRLKKVGEDTLRVKIPDAVDSSGKPIEAFHDVKFEVWNVARLFAD